MKLCFNNKYLKEYKRSRNNVHDPIPVTYQTFAADDGKMYFQLDTYSKNVKIDTTGALDQSDSKIQFDKETAEKFIDLLRKELSIS
jgi:hypothetical protein